MACAQMPEVTMVVVELGPVCLQWDHQAHRCEKTTLVHEVQGKRAAHFLARLAVSVNGAPRAYHKDDDHRPQNSRRAFGWMTNVRPGDLHGIQGADGFGPSPGFYVSATTLTNPDIADAKDTRRYVDASTVPYIVLPEAAFPVPDGTTLRSGCVTFVVDRRNGRWSGGIFADVGHCVGKASLALALRLGLRPFYSATYPKVAGFDDEEFETRFFYLVFPDTVIAPPWPEQAIQAKAKAMFDAWGGEAQLKALYPGTHALLPPDPVSLPPSAEYPPPTA